MNPFINQRYAVATYTKEDGQHCDSEFFSTKKEAIEYAKDDILSQFEKHKCLLYAEISNFMKPEEKIVMEVFEVGERIYVFDPYLIALQKGGYQGGRAYGVIKEIAGMKAKIKYDDTEELVTEVLTDLRKS